MTIVDEIKNLAGVKDRLLSSEEIDRALFGSTKDQRDECFDFLTDKLNKIPLEEYSTHKENLRELTSSIKYYGEVLSFDMLKRVDSYPIKGE